MKRILLCILIIFLTTTWSYAKEFQTVIDKPGIDQGTVRNLMANGQLIIIEEKNGQLVMTTAGILINAPVDKVYATLIDFEKYPEFMPSTEGTKIIKEENGSKDVQYNIAFKFSLLKFKVQYTLRHTFVKNKSINWTLVKTKDGKLKSTYGSWQLFSAPGGQTAAFYSTQADLRSISSLLRAAFNAEPSMEIALAASSCVMVVKAVKSRIEKQ